MNEILDVSLHRAGVGVKKLDRDIAGGRITDGLAVTAFGLARPFAD